MRLVRRLVVLVLVLALLAGLGNVALGRVAEDRTEVALQSALGLDSRPEVTIDAFPILLRVAQGTIPRLAIDGRDLRIEELDVTRFHLGADDLSVSLAELTKGLATLRVGGGGAWAEVTEEAANAFLERKGERGRVRFLEDRVQVTSRVSYLGRPRRLEATGTLELQGDELVFQATKVTVDGGDPPPGFGARARRDASFRVDIPPLPGGIRPKRVAVQEGVARFEADFGRTTLDLRQRA